MTDVWLVTVHGSRPLVVRCSAALTLSGALDIPWDTLLTVLEAVVETWRFMREHPKNDCCENFLKAYLRTIPPVPELSSNDMVATNEKDHNHRFVFFSPPLSSENLGCHAPIRLQWTSSNGFGHSLSAVREQTVGKVTVSIPAVPGTGTLAVTRTSFVLTIDGGEEILHEHNWGDLHPGELIYLGVYMFAEGFRVAIGGEGTS